MRCFHSSYSPNITRLQRLLRLWPFLRESLCNPDQACLHNFRIRDAEHVGGLFFEQEMQGCPDRPEPTRAGGQHETPCCWRDRPPHSTLYERWLPLTPPGEAG